MSARLLVIGRLSLFAGLVLIVPLTSAPAEVAGSQREEDARLFDRLVHPPSVPQWVSEDQREFYLATEEARRELDSLQPLFTRLGVQILQELKELDQRPEGALGEWAQALHRRHTSLAGMTAGIVLREVIGGRDPLEGRTPDEREVLLGNVPRRLIHLTITGRMTKEEYDSFVRRLRGN
jgi:hypothetical protein